MRTLDEARTRIIQLQEELSSVGASDAASRLQRALTDFYTTSTEALISLDAALTETRSVWLKHLTRQRIAEIEHLQVAVRRMMNLH
jgi:hypothetical protein